VARAFCAPGVCSSALSSYLFEYIVITGVFRAVWGHGAMPPPSPLDGETVKNFYGVFSIERCEVGEFAASIKDPKS